MKETKLLFFDIDGTLWDFNGIIPESTKVGLKKAKENGHKIFINSGRSMGHIKGTALLDLGFDGIVSACGTVVEYNNQVIFSHFLSNDVLAQALSLTKPYKFRSILEGYNYLYLDKIEWDEADPYFIKISRELGEDLLSTNDSWGNWDKVCKFSSDTTGGDMDGGLRAISNHFDYIKHNENVVEVVPKGFDKSTGIEFLCKTLNVPKENTFAFGDAQNDKVMLEYAGVGIAMGNGSDAIKEVADYVTSPMKKDGIYNALVHFNLI